jgi:hypothetical protein
MITDYGFTEQQLASIYEVLNNIKKTNDSLTSNTKIDGIEYYVDNQGNFYTAYCEADYSGEGPTFKLVYTAINSFGGIVDLNSIYANQEDIVKKLSRYRKISLI